MGVNAFLKADRADTASASVTCSEPWREDVRRDTCIRCPGYPQAVYQETAVLGTRKALDSHVDHAAPHA